MPDYLKPMAMLHGLFTLVALIAFFASILIGPLHILSLVAGQVLTFAALSAAVTAFFCAFWLFGLILRDVEKVEDANKIELYRRAKMVQWAVLVMALLVTSFAYMVLKEFQALGLSALLLTLLLFLRPNIGEFRSKTGLEK